MDVERASLSARITVSGIATRLNIGRLAVYEMLERGILPGIRLGRRWIVTRHAYEQWERTCGLAAPPATDPGRHPEEVKESSTTGCIYEG